ncbi:DUF3857 domain-containing protein [Mucilaginibacter achroorhodeus]|uniref:DUF3857 domain-containing protein n=1 Tax=Mucilaginibacter achroorhodeus TaxID=2599294 RepID=A0A563TY00_9SPHI|nr:DUF3857 domain-containing protein [Mucilaginibacter achroorhodeus]TWR24238.1 DUF3857 domain-containing protein [Mucilaginibacter achroorhodeus]
MNKTIAAIAFCIAPFLSLAQSAETNSNYVAAQPFGKVEVADLELKSCDFEKDANAEVLFDIGSAGYDPNMDLSLDRHKRIKIFNINGKDNANIRIEFYSGNRLEYINGLQAQTINLVDGKPEITKLDKKLIYTEQIDKNRSALVFSMPNVKAGSIIEYKYSLRSNSLNNFPDWYFQSKLPTRYSEFKTYVPDFMTFQINAHVEQPLVKYSAKSEGRSYGTGTNLISYSLETTYRALANVPSLPDEAYMTASADNLQKIAHQLTAVRPLGTYSPSYSDSWAKVGGILADDEDFGSQLKRKLANEEVLITKAKSLKTDDQKIQYLFNEVRNSMKWNGVDRWYTNDGTVKAWEKKAGNSAEINIILYHLLKKADVKAFPMVVSTREHGKVVPYFTFLYQFNRAVVYVPMGEGKSYILDATGKYNQYNETPYDLLNSSGLYIDKENEKYDIVMLQRDDAVRQVVMLKGEVTNDGKLDGNAQISSFSYNRVNALNRYKDDGEKKYTDYLRDNNNALNISSLKLENTEVDSLPLVQNVNFKLDLTGSDENYIYFVPNMFSALKANPFLSENRRTDIDFGYKKSYTIIGSYKLPANYKLDALPKNVTLKMPDESILFRRVASAENGMLMIRYQIDQKAISYGRDIYPMVHEFYKKMYEMLNEQIVLKKS